MPEALHWDLWKVQFCHCNDGQMSARNMRLSPMCDYSVDGIRLSKVVIFPFLDTHKLLWQFFCWYLGFLLFHHSSFPRGVVGLLSWIIFDINMVGGQEGSWYGRLFHQWFELVATASATIPLLVAGCLYLVPGILSSGEGEAYFDRCSLKKRSKYNFRHCERKRSNLSLPAASSNSPTSLV